ncbi:MAG: UDP-N-acetylmuramoyl-L-alanyl-D-glutamate--2,6-diaminopimelate ligase [Flammeovirgaceae bacterium]
MTLLSKILENIRFKFVQGNLETQVNEIQIDSRKVQKGNLFVAIKGTENDGHQYIPQVIEKGASVIVCENIPNGIPSEVTVIQVDNAGILAGILASNFYDNPSSKLKVVAVTGTNGKTTTATLLYELFRKLGYAVGLFSTVVNKINGDEIPTNLTTPDAITIQKLMAEMVKKKCSFVFMEASSHAIVQGRLSGLQIKGAIFTNITHDHLDYHKTFQNYINAKKLLFDGLSENAFALVNLDDKRGQVMLQNCKAKHYTFALKTMADFQAKIIHNSFDGLHLNINGKEAWFRLIGDFNAYNLLGIYATAVLLGENPEEVLRAMSELRPAVGRFEQMISPNMVRGIVDYAHTPDALQNVLETILKIKKSSQKVITVVGCGGNRDATKRPIMAKIAAQMSDKVILTSDNPRNEDPEEILRQMELGLDDLEKKKSVKIVDRREAIKYAVQLAHQQDIILLAGKGHETYQEIKGVKHHFDDKEELSKAFESDKI